MKIQHSIDGERNRLVFARASDRDRSFSILSSGNFPANVFYGLIQTSHFSTFGVLRANRSGTGLCSCLFPTRPAPTPRRYCMLLYFKISPTGREIDILLVVCQDLNEHIITVRRHPDVDGFVKGPDSGYIRIETEEVEIEIEDPQTEVQRHWEVSSVKSLKLYKAAIDCWSDRVKFNTSGVLPAFQLKAQYDRGQRSVDDFSRKLKLNGVQGEETWLELKVTSETLTGVSPPEVDYSQADLSKAYNTLCKCCVGLTKAMSQEPLTLASELFQAGFIPQECLDETLQLNETKQAKATRLYSAVLDSVKSFPTRLVSFMDILRRNRILYSEVVAEINNKLM